MNDFQCVEVLDWILSVSGYIGDFHGSSYFAINDEETRDWIAVSIDLVVAPTPNRTTDDVANTESDR